MFTIRGCSPKRCEICPCTHVPEIQCKTLSTWYTVKFMGIRDHWPLRDLQVLQQPRCEDKPSPACGHTVPNSRAELLIRTIPETNMALWTFGMENCSVH